MANSDSFMSFLRELFAPAGAITVRRMFSGAAVYCDGQIFALVTGDTLYFKVDDQTRPNFEAEDMTPLQFDIKDGVHIMNGYWRAPERLFDEPEELRDWVRTAVAVGHRATKAKPKPKKIKPRK